jgi:DNA-directed RNA polymerase subunit RPC12/RpoP
MSTRNSTIFSRLPLQFSARHRCPYCNSRSACRERRHGIFQRVMCFVLGVRPYLCFNCDQIYYVRWKGEE